MNLINFYVLHFPCNDFMLVLAICFATSFLSMLLIQAREVVGFMYDIGSHDL